MPIVWDETSRLSNFAKHGLDFADLDEGFFVAAIISPMRPGRHMATGRLDGMMVSVVFAPLRRVCTSWAGSRLGHFHAAGEPEGTERTMTKFSKSRPLTDAEEAEIQAMIAGDPDSPELTAEEVANMRSFAETFPALAESFKRSRGRPRVEDPKEAITLRLSAKTIERFKSRSGENWRALMVETLEAS